MFHEKMIAFESDGFELAGVLRLPKHLNGKTPGVLLVHGSMEQDRDGNLLQNREGKHLFKKNFFLEISRHICSAGFAALSWDRRGFGKSKGWEKRGFTLDTVRDTRAALDCLCEQDEIDRERIAILGQSAGVYTACLLAKEDFRPKAYILQGGLYRDYSEMMAFNYLRIVDYTLQSHENLDWVEANDLPGLMIGLNLSKIEKGAKEGIEEHELTYKGRTWRYHHDPLAYVDEYAPANQFRFIDKPTLVIHGECDLNVPVEDAFMVQKELEANENKDVELVIISRADHSFQTIARDEDLRLKERMSLESFRRPYKDEYFDAVIDFLKRKL